jgi:hypothetical protein
LKAGCDTQLQTPGLPSGIRVVESTDDDLPYLHLARMEPNGTWSSAGGLGEPYDSSFTTWGSAEVLSVSTQEVAGLEVLRVDTSYAWLDSMPEYTGSSSGMYEMSHQEYATLCVRSVNLGWVCPIMGEVRFESMMLEAKPDEKTLDELSGKQPPLVGSLEVSKTGIATLDMANEPTKKMVVDLKTFEHVDVANLGKSCTDNNCILTYDLP